MAAGRIIIPYKIGGDLVTWTGRAIAPAQIRYKDLDLNTALVPAKETLFNYDVIAEGGEALTVERGELVGHLATLGWIGGEGPGEAAGHVGDVHGARVAGGFPGGGEGGDRKSVV